MTDNTLITPPRELVALWIAEGNRQDYCTTDEYLIDKVARWGYERRGAVNEAALQKARDEELEACCNVLDKELGVELYSVGGSSFLRAARRPKPKSQAEGALTEIEEVEGAMYSAGLGCDFTATRAALERLRELEQSND